MKINNNGTDERFPTSSLNRNPRDVQYSGNMRVPSMTLSHGMNLSDMEFEVHRIETEAYSAVLRAFIAQSDVLSWGKEGLISELRKELRVSDVEHRELLGKVNSDDSVRVIREWRKGTIGEKELFPNTTNPHTLVHSSMSYASSKRSKTLHVPVSSSPNYLPHAQPPPAATPPLATHFSSQLGGEAAIFSTKRNTGQSQKSVFHNRQASIVSKGSRPVIIQSKKGHHASDTDTMKKKSDTIEIRATDRIIHEVERMIFHGESPNPVQLEKAKLMLKEHERAIVTALDKLADLSDEDNYPHNSPHWSSYEEQQRNEHQLATHQAFYGQVDMAKGYYISDFNTDHTDIDVHPFRQSGR